MIPDIFAQVPINTSPCPSLSPRLRSVVGDCCPVSKPYLPCPFPFVQKLQSMKTSVWEVGVPCRLPQRAPLNDCCCIFSCVYHCFCPGLLLSSLCPLGGQPISGQAYREQGYSSHRQADGHGVDIAPAVSGFVLCVGDERDAAILSVQPPHPSTWA